MKTSIKLSTGFIGWLVKCNLQYNSVEEFTAKETLAALSKKMERGVFVVDFCLVILKLSMSMPLQRDSIYA